MLNSWHQLSRKETIKKNQYCKYKYKYKIALIFTATAATSNPATIVQCTGQPRGRRTSHPGHHARLVIFGRHTLYTTSILQQMIKFCLNSLEKFWEIGISVGSLHAIFFSKIGSMLTRAPLGGRFCPLSNSWTDGRRKTGKRQTKALPRRILKTPKILLKKVRGQVRVRSKVKTTGLRIIGFRAQLAQRWSALFTQNASRG